MQFISKCHWIKRQFIGFYWQTNVKLSGYERNTIRFWYFINIHFRHFTTICKGLYIISSDVSAGMLSAHKEYKTMATQHFTPTKSILPNHCTYWKKSLVSLVLHRLGLCLQFSPLFSRHMSFFCQIKFTFRQLASIENALITSIDSNLGG